MNAVEAAGLIGKYVRMERPATIEELDAGEPTMVGMEAQIVGVWDEADGSGCAIVGDYGMGFTVYPGEDWRFRVFINEEVARDFMRWNP